MQDKKFPKILLVHPGTQYSYKLAEQLSKRKYLYYFFTGIAISGKSLVYKIWKLLPKKFRRMTANRIVYQIESKELKLIPYYELNALREVRQLKNNDEIFFKRNEKFQKKISSHTIRQSSAIIGFDTSSWLIADVAMKANIPFILDVSIAHSASKQKVYQNISSSFPSWEFNLDFKEKKFLEIEEIEYKRATAIVVASGFTKKTLIDNGVKADKIFVNPYGVDLSRFAFKERPIRPVIRFLFVGIVDARKGIPLLLEAWRKFADKDVELTLLGPVTDKVRELIDGYGLRNVVVAGKVPHSELPKILESHDVFVFPSYFEGFGLVILEAMASGMPVITTVATAGLDIISEGKDGFIIKAGDGNALRDRIEFFLDNPGQVNKMGLAAAETAQKYGWDRYGDRWIDIINKVVNLNS